jgi:hypothetical protein
MIFVLSVVAGFLVAICGAWKDTLFEPFKLRKFFRSPLVVTFWALVLFYCYPARPGVLLVLSACALERLSVEGWKAIIRKPPGKFARPERDTRWLSKRLKGHGTIWG